MYKTIDITLTNGKSDDHSQTLYITIHQSTHCWSYHIAWETSGDGYDYAESGDNSQIVGALTEDWWLETIQAAIEDMVLTQTAIRNFSAFVESDEGSWMETLTADDFSADKWDEHSN